MGTTVRLFSLLLLMSCGKPNIRVFPPVVIGPTDEEFLELKTRFYAEASKLNIKPNDSSIVKGKTSIVGAAAMCNFGERSIVVDESIWADLPDWKREFAIFHELGHCSLERVQHVESYPAIMNPDFNQFNEQQYNDGREEYIRDLFLNKNL